jgi:hypothetical protein
VSGALQNVHLRVNDAATGQPTPVRIRCTGPDGTYYAPFGRLARLDGGWSPDHAGNVVVDGKTYAYIDGACEIRLPVGQVSIDVFKGPEYTPLHEVISLTPGKLALRLTIQRWTNEREKGWYSGEFGQHLLTPHAALLEAAGEDLAVVNLLASELTVAGSVRTPNLLAFSGQRPALELPGHLVVVNTLNWHAVLGHLALLNAHRIVFPLTFGDPGADDWTLTDWCDQCHRKGGLVVWADPGANEYWRGDQPGYEALAGVILGKVDAVTWNPWVLGDWYALLDCGFRAPLCWGGEDRDRETPLGRYRTYALLEAGQEFNYRNWIEAVRAGRTYLTGGPLLEFTAAGAPPGATVDVAAGPRAVRVRARARGYQGVGKLEVIANGQVIAATSGVTREPDGTATLALDEEVTVERSGWLAASCVGENDAGDRALMSHTSPIFVRLGGQPLQAPGDTVRQLLAEIDHSLAWVEHDARCDTDAQRQRLAAVFQQARQVLTQLPTAPEAC